MDAVERIRRHTKTTETLHKNALAEARTETNPKLMGEVDETVKRVLAESNETRAVLGELQRHKTGREGAKIRAVGRVFLQVTGSFERVQDEYRERYRKQLERQYRLIDPTGGHDGEPLQLSELIGGESLKWSDSQTSLRLSQQIFKLPDDSNARRQLESLKERNAEMNQLARGVEELHCLFTEIAALVNEQGDQINKVEDYVLEMCANVEKTTGILDEAIEIHKRKQAKRRTVLLVSSVILAGLLVIIANELGLFSILYRIIMWFFK